jgi:branched-subunit amino acid ABC-type transport system permease component
MHALQLVGYFQDYQLTWSYFFDQLVAGLTLGSLYGLIALGYSMVYGILKLLNFAHGEVFMIGSYIGYFVLTAFGGATSPDIPVALLIALMFAAAMVGSGGLGVAIERFAYRPLRVKRAPRIAPLISALGSRSACSRSPSSASVRRRSSTTPSASTAASSSRASPSGRSRSSTCSSS